MTRILHKVSYNSQRDNLAIGDITGGRQCGYSCACMLISTVNPEAAKDYWVAAFVDSMEPRFGKKGVGEWILTLAPFKWLRGRRVGSYMPAYAAAISKYLGGTGREVKYNFDTNKETIFAAIDAGSPVMIGTKITESGHFILIVGYDKEKGVWICHDPFGNAVKKYNRRYSGAYVEYGFEWLESRVNNLDMVRGKWRAIWLSKK